MYTVYILRSLKTGRYYTGSTEEINHRLSLHNSGQNKSTKQGVPCEVVYTKVLLTRLEAVRKENQIKSRGAGRYLADANYQPG